MAKPTETTSKCTGRYSINPNAHQPSPLVADMEQALAFYGQLGFASPYHDEGFAILERDRIALQFNVSDPTHEPPKEGCRMCYIVVTQI